MISLSAITNGVQFTFTDSKYYLYGNGTIVAPLNSLSLVIDNSGAATFKKAASNDIFVSAPLSEFGMTAEQIESFYKSNMVGSTGGVDPEEVVDIVDESTNYIDGVDYVSSANTINFYHGEELVDSIDTSDFVIDGMIENVSIETISGASYLVIDFNTASGKEDIQIPLTDIFNPDNYYTKQEIDASLSGKSDVSAVTAVNNVLTAHTANTAVHVTAGDKLYWDGKSDFSGSYNDLTDKPTIPTVPTSNTAFTNDAGYITEDAISGKADTSAVTAINNVVTAHTADTTIHVTSSDKSTWSGKQDALVSGTNIKTINNESILGSGNITISGGGSGTAAVEVTQVEYDALVSGGTVDPTVFYVITDAPAIDLSGYVQTSAITSSVTSASTNSEIPTAKAVYDAIPTGSTSYSAGTNISINTANTISCTLPISAPTGTNSIVVGNGGSRSQGNQNIVGGLQCNAIPKGSSANPDYCIVVGNYLNAYNSYEAAFGSYNNSVQNTGVGGNSGTTLFSIGNGSANARHNALEIRQNGDIYCSNGTSDVKLQDYIQFKIVKLTQQEYDALVSGGTVQNDTVYLITNVVS